jgi:2-polyprenyl-3-methyl-5-hydroxy-6-metoxy-1,4-benzoquinol methylase
MRRARHFDFGKNWKSFSDSALTEKHIGQALSDFHNLMKDVPLKGRSFLDIGFGQGLTLCLAYRAGATCYALDIDPTCVEALRSTARFFPDIDADSIPVVAGSILDDRISEKLRQLRPVKEAGGFDVVHSWGVLHHTGTMQNAIQRAASLVRSGGHLVLAIYNTHWTSPIWHLIKRIYVRSPRVIQRILIALFFPLIFVAKLAVTRRHPFKQARGMDFYHDVIDWIGGYPYEYATVEEIKRLVESLGFRLERTIPTGVPTGCNQFVFRSQGSSAPRRSSAA